MIEAKRKSTISVALQVPFPTTWVTIIDYYGLITDTLITFFLLQDTVLRLINRLKKMDDPQSIYPYKSVIIINLKYPVSWQKHSLRVLRGGAIFNARGFQICTGMAIPTAINAVSLRVTTD